jgi:hypothetical protein
MRAAIIRGADSRAQTKRRLKGGLVLGQLEDRGRMCLLGSI